MKNIILSAFVAIFTLLLFVARPVNADGIIELRSTNGQNYRCWVSYLQMQDKSYNMLVSCRDLLYPADTTLFTYVLWGIPATSGEPFKLGALGFGKAYFKTKNAFSSLIVTAETDEKVKGPSGDIVMQGQSQSITFLDRPTSPTPLPSGAQVTATPSITVEKLTTQQRLILGLKRAGLISLLALVAVIGLVFVVTRSRGK